MLTDNQLRTASRDDLTALCSRIFPELARRNVEGEPQVTGSMVVESRPHADGLLLLEKRIFRPKTGGPIKVRGPYWTFRFNEDGKRRSLYIGKTDDPERVLEEVTPLMGSGVRTGKDERSSLRTDTRGSILRARYVPGTSTPTDLHPATHSATQTPQRQSHRRH